MNSEWHNASRDRPCPVCHHTDWCTITNDGLTCVCRRVESDRPAKSGYGWIHRLGSGGKVGRRGGGGQWNFGKFNSGRLFKTEDEARHCLTSDLEPRTSSPNFAALHASFDGHPDMQDGLAFGLGLDGDSFTALDVRYNAANECMSFPMRDAEGRITGLRYRHLTSGKKWSARGSKDGLFFDPHPGAYGTNETDGRYFPNELVVLEGPTDTAAALSLGLPAVGRSACLTGAAVLKGLIRRLGIRRLTIVADNDKPHERPGGGTWYPGLDGAKHLAKEMRVPCRIVLPPPAFKDMREWWRHGNPTTTAFYSAATAAKWLM